MLQPLISIDRLIARFERTVVMVLILAIVFILIAQVVLRYFFANPIFWAEDVTVQMLGAVTCVGVSYLTYRNEMVKVDFLLMLLPKSTIGLVQRLIYFIGLVTMCIVCWYAIDWIVRPENQLSISPTTGLLKWYNHLFMVICFHLMALHLFVKCLAPIEQQSQIVED
ncbi:TRAP transporter small permease [Gallibacterium salpingitidis]|uniref:TRAP transporter small permease n=1 Tax=Gallibacterium salpingitidis TaxID=505341 RepID=UPI00082521A4|nr:TRAP transporter small permease subunit [Gallibacterium salpingitidis]